MTNDNFHDIAVSCLLVCVVCFAATTLPVGVAASFGGIGALYLFRVVRFIGERS